MVKDSRGGEGAKDAALGKLVRCLERDPRSHVVDGIGWDAPAAIVPRRPVQNVRTGRWGRVLIRSHTAVKIQKVVCRDGRLQQVEWHNGPARTRVTLDAFQELIAAQLFGILDIGPTVKHILLVRTLPEWVDEGGDHQDCWYLIMCMQKLHGTMRDIKHMPAAEARRLWAGMRPERLAALVSGLAELHVDHGDLRLDNVGYRVSAKGVKAVALDFAYCKVKPGVCPAKLGRDMGEQLAGVLKDAGAPRRLCSSVVKCIAGAPLAQV